MSVFFTSRKTVLKSQLDTSLIPCYLSSFSSIFLNAISTPPRYLVNRSRKLLPPRQLLDSWWTDRASVLAFDGLFLDTSSIPVYVNNHFLDTFLDSYLDTSQYLHLSSFTKGLYNLLVRSAYHFLRSLSRQLSHFSLPNILISLQSCFLRFLQDFSSFSSLGKLLISQSSCISCFETQVLGFLKNFGVFQN